VKKLTTTNQKTMTSELFPVCFAGSQHPYAVGPLPMDQITPLYGELVNGYPFTIEVPNVFASIRHHPGFLGGCQFGFESSDDETYTPVSLCNFVCRVLHEEFREPDMDGDTYLWVIGFVLGWLASVAETEPVLARVGIRHLCFLLSYIPSSLLPRYRYRALNQVDSYHTASMKAYRAQVRTFTGQDIEVRIAYYLAFTLPLTPLDASFVLKIPRSPVQPQGVLLPFPAQNNHDR